ncbi:MAG: aromatic hydrocarbon degradation protein, partial [Sulfurimonas sp.]
YELPDSDSVAVSLGARYKINDKIDIGLAGLYSMRKDRTITAANNDNNLEGTFSNADVLIISAGLGYKF